MAQGIFITFEGPDGAGKTTVLRELQPRLEALGQSVVTTREPGGVRIAEEIRSVILHPQHTEMDDKTELLLYIAARRQHLKERILPALKSGKLLLVDRFIDSSVAYQGFGRGLDIDAINWLNDYATDGLKPDLTLYFDIDVKEGLERIARNAERDINRLDMEKIEMHERVRQGYLTILEQEAGRVVRLDASQSVEEVVETAFSIIKERFLGKL